MKKSTKILTTVVALVLVVGFMVVGIMAATSASANINAQVSWTATAGVEFDMRGGVFFSQEHYDAMLQSAIAADAHNFAEPGEEEDWVKSQYPGEEMFSYEWAWAYKDNYFLTLGDAGFGPPTHGGRFNFSVNTATTNDEAAGLSAALNASFCDPTEDGVNNPIEIYYVYEITANSDIKVQITNKPNSANNVQVKWYGEEAQDQAYEDYLENKFQGCEPTVTFRDSVSADKISVATGKKYILVMELSVVDSESNVSNFNADVSFSISVS